MQEVATMRRRIARGDVLLCTPIIRAVRERLHPDPKFQIFVETGYPEILRRNPRINLAGTVVPKREPYIYDLGIHFERLPGWHIIDALALGAGFRPGEVPRRLEMYPTPDDRSWARMHANTDRLCGDFIVLAPGPGIWAGRNWPEPKWRKIAQGLLDKGQRTVLVGTKESHALPCSLDLRDKTCFMKLAAVIKLAKLFIGIDGFPIHVAGAMHTPRVGIFGVTRADCILCDSPRTVAVSSDPQHPLTGARHKVATMKIVERDITPYGNPMDGISMGQVWHAIDLQLCPTSTVNHTQQVPQCPETTCLAAATIGAQKLPSPL